MCGISGYLQNSNSNFLSSNQIEKIINSTQHRGPDDSGYWLSNSKNLLLCHNRLSILDLSKNGSQPMVSQSRNLVIVYNGEIYNSPEIREKLTAEGVSFKSTSDTEVLIEACDLWGIDKTINMIIGMFAFALYDLKNSILYLVRDRMGIKPLYYGKQKNLFYFGSELVSIKSMPDLSLTINKSALSNFLEFSYVPNPKSIYNEVDQLEPGTILKIDKDLNIEKKKYWDVKDSLSENDNNNLDNNSFINIVHNLIEESVNIRMLSDAPIGCFLSGGIDSSLVASLMQKNSLNKIDTFTIGFQESNYNEAIYAKQVANHIGTNHNEYFFSEKDAINIIPDISDFYCEPFADSSQIPTLLLSKFTSNKVKVALSGDGGDEIFRGYNRYAWTNKIARINQKTPKLLRILLSSVLKSVPDILLNQIIKINILNQKLPNLKNKINKISDLVLINSEKDIYQYLLKNNNELNNFIKYPVSNYNIYKLTKNLDFSNFNLEMQYIDLIKYLPDDILTKVDRASMSYGLEVRVPLIDHRIIEVMMKNSLRDDKLMNEKKILKKILSYYVPEKIFERPKMGFGAPLGKWLKDPLKDWVLDLFSSRKFKENEFFNNKYIIKTYRDHLNNNFDNSYKLWPILVFISWLEKYA